MTNLDATMKEIDNSSFCSEAKRDAKKIFRAFAGEKEETYSIGDRFQSTDGEKYLLVAADVGKIILVDLDSGKRYYRAIAVLDIWNVTESEFSQICHDRPEDFTRIEKPC